MSGESPDVTMLVKEYECLIDEVGLSKQSLLTSEQLQQLESKMVSDGDWTPEAAEELISLVRNYGSFMLRNALAIALAAGIEDGEAGF